MKFKVLLLPFLISSLTACSDNPVQNNNHFSTNGLFSPQVQGDITQFGGAARLKEDRSIALKNSIQNNPVKHVILFIGDGTSDSELTSARNYAEGASGYFKGLDVLPFTGSYTTYSIDQDKTINYVTDSAASASAWATGTKTYNGALSVDIHGISHESILSLAKKAGFATGNVTTTELQDATPAALISHVTSRKCYGPNATSEKCASNALENGGLGSISEQLLQARADVTLGGGYATFKEKAKAGKYKDQTLLDQAKALNYQVITDLDGLNSVQSANQNSPVLGLFDEGNLPVSWAGPSAELNGNFRAAEKCKINPARSASTPSLKAMTAKAIELLEQNKKGFFLQVESGSIDKANHIADACGQIGETVALDEAVQVALEFAKKNPDTLIIITGDHAHTSQIIPNESKSPGKTVKLITKDNAPMTINYASSTTESQEHTGAQVHTAAYGPHAANISGLIDQTDIFFIMKNALGIQ